MFMFMLIYFKIVLKHRQNTNQKQRIIAFLGSPLNSETTTKESLKELGLKMKKNGIAIDLIDFGTENRSNTPILEGLIEAVDSEAQVSRLITIETDNSGGSSGTFLLDSLKSKVPELFNRSNSSNNELNGGDGFDFDPEMDPELAMALKLSMEEEVNRQLKEVNTNEKTENENENSINEDEEDDDDDHDHDIKIDEEEDDEELLLARAIALSMEQEKSEEKK